MTSYCVRYRQHFVDRYRNVSQLGTHLNSLISTSSGKPRDVRMPIACKNRATVCSKLLLASVRSTDIPQLYTSILGDSSKCMRHMRTELYISDTFCVTAQQNKWFKRENYTITIKYINARILY